MLKLIRKKSSPDQTWEIVEETDTWYIDRAGNTYAKANYELTTALLWRNVTRDIIVIEPFSDKGHYNPGGVFHKGIRIAQLVCGGDYRLVVKGDHAVIEEKVK